MVGGGGLAVVNAWEGRGSGCWVCLRAIFGDRVYCDIFVLDLGASKGKEMKGWTGRGGQMKGWTEVEGGRRR